MEATVHGSTIGITTITITIIVTITIIITVTITIIITIRQAALLP
jgi:hypothetical protein